MPLSRRFLEPNAGRPQDVSDVDVRRGFAHLVQRQVANVSNQVSIWTTARWINAVFAGIAAVLWFVCWPLLVYQDSLASEFAELPLAGKITAGVFAALFALFLLGMSLGAFSQGKLVIDRQRRELRFYSGLCGSKLRHVTYFKDIRALISKTVDGHSHDSPSDGHPVTSHRVIVAETHDGTLELIATDADWHAASLYREIEQAIEPSPIDTRQRPRELPLLT